MEMTPVKSSNVSAVGWEPLGEGADTGTLAIEFVSGGTYYYAGTPREIYEGLLASPSPGSYVHRNVRDQYRARKA